MSSVLEFNRLSNALVALSQRWLAIPRWVSSMIPNSLNCRQDRRVSNCCARRLERSWTLVKRRRRATTSVFIDNREITHMHNFTILPKDQRDADTQDEMCSILDCGTASFGRLASLRGRLIHLFASCPERLTRNLAADFCVENDWSQCLPLPASVKRSQSWKLACISLSPCQVCPRVRHSWPHTSDVLWSDTAVGNLSGLAFHPTRPPWVVWSIYGMLSCRSASPGRPRSL